MSGPRSRSRSHEARLAGILSVGYPEIRLEDMILAEDVESRLRRIVHEQGQQSRLRSRGLQPRSKLVVTGPPGSGKTLTAKASTLPPLQALR